MDKFSIIVDRKQVFFRVFVINTQPTDHQLSEPALKKQLIALDKKSHPFLSHDSIVNCAQLHPIKVRDVEQHIREKPRDMKCRISTAIRDQILKIVPDSVTLTEEEKEAVVRSLTGA